MTQHVPDFRIDTEYLEQVDRRKLARFPAELPAQNDPTIAYAEEHVRLHGVRLYRQTWRPREVSVVGVVVYTHGMHSHGMRPASNT